MQLNDNQKQLLAELKSMPAFVLLLCLFKEHEESLLSAMAAAEGDKQLKRLGRQYQWTRGVREFLEFRPEAIAEELERAKAEAAEWDKGIPDGRELWAARYGQDQAEPPMS